MNFNAAITTDNEVQLIWIAGGAGGGWGWMWEGGNMWGDDTVR